MTDTTRLDPITSGKPAGSRAGNKYGSFVVHYCSPAQARFIQRLLDERDHEFTIADPSKVNKKHASRIIETLLACPKKAGVFTLPTNKQISYIDLLVTNRVDARTIVQSYLNQNGAKSLYQLDREKVALLITALKAQPTIDSVTPAIDPVVEVGAYLHDGVIYSVRQSKESGRFHALFFNEETRMWEYVRGMAEQIKGSERLTLSQAIQHSAQTGSCVHCGRTLTLQKSVLAGMGRICASKYH